MFNLFAGPFLKESEEKWPKSPPNSDLIQNKFEIKESGQNLGISERLKTG